MFPRVVFGGRVLQAQLASASSSSTSRQREHVAPRPSCLGETATLRSRALSFFRLQKWPAVGGAVAVGARLPHG